MQRRCSNLLLSLWLSLSLPAAGDTFVVGYYRHGMPPLFFAEDDPRPGIYREVLEAVGQLTGDRFLPRYDSVARIINDFGVACDIEPGIHPEWRPDQSEISLYTYPFMVSGDVVAMRRQQAFAITRAEDLAGQRVGLVRGYLYPGWMPNEGGFIGDFSRDEQVLFEKVRRHRIDIFFAPPVMIDYYIREWGLDLIKVQELYRFPLSFRLHRRHQAALPRIDAALRQLERDGTLAAIVAKYTAQPAPAPAPAASAD